MAVLRSIIALASLAALLLSAVPTPVTALAADRVQVYQARHDLIAKRKRSDPTSSNGRCIPRSSSSPTPTPSISSTPSAAPSATPAGYDSSKKWGLGWGADEKFLANFASLPKVQFLYDWSPDYPSNTKDLGLKPMPMLHDPNQIAEFDQKVVQGYAQYVLGQNEPNEPATYEDPKYAAQIWMDHIDHLKDEGYFLISPACTDDDEGKKWYSDFFAACQGCRIDCCAVHHYTPNATHFIEYDNYLHDTYGIDVCITEFADQNFSGVGGQDTMSQVWDFAGQIKNFVETTPWVFMAMPFGAMLDLQGVNPNNALMNSDGTPTKLAYYYYS